LQTRRRVTLSGISTYHFAVQEEIMFKITTAVTGLLLLAACATVPSLSPQVAQELAPTGKIRIGLNYGNTNFARNPASGPEGIAVDLARELGRRTGLPVELVGYPSGGGLTAGLKAGGWDVAFLAYEQEREKEIDFAAVFAQIEGTYLVPAGSPFRNASELDRQGVRIAVSERGGNDLFLTRTLKQAQLVRASGSEATWKRFVSEKLDAYAGLRPSLLTDTAKLPGSRVVEGRYTVIPYSVGIIKGRTAGAKYLRDFIEDTKASGLIGRLLEKNGVPGITPAPRAN
jgi:polar amino acid transport system substrate-binding protein